jgi:4-cresol dehydrogenase (hydroxylating)
VTHNVSDISILDDAFFADPYPALAELRKDEPCWYDSRLDAHVVTRYHDIEHVLQDERFSAERVRQFGRGAPEHTQAHLEACNQELERWLLFRDPPAHTPLRSRLSGAIGSHLLPDVRRLASVVVAKAITELSWVEQPDLVRDLAYPVPTQILAQLLGVDFRDIEQFKQWTTDIFALIGAGLADEQAIELGYRGVVGLHEYAIELLNDRRRNPRNDLLSVLGMQAPGPEGSVISDDDIVGMFMTTIVAGHETTSNLIANALSAIMADARSREWVISHHGITEGSVDELARFDGPVFSLIRRARRDVTVAGKRVREGECVFSMLNAGNRDPRKFSDPDRLDFDRPRPVHLGFGVGMHACLGAMIARAVVSETVTALFTAYPDVATLPGSTWQRNLSIRGMATLPVELGMSTTRRQCQVLVAKLVDTQREVGVEVEVDTSDAATSPLRDLAENRSRRVDAVVRASNTEGVSRVVLAARELGVPLYPISMGMNCGLGSRSPVVVGGFLLALDRMNRIRELDLEHGLAVIEPGVTQAELAGRLVGSPFFLNVTTSCKDSSVLGNALDRGQGMIRLRIDELLGLEVVLADGTVIETGGVGPSGSRSYYGRGSGPDATRLFLQSNFGVVTAGAIALVPRPESTSYAYASFAGEALPLVVDCLARLRREHVLEHIFYFGEMQLDAATPGLPNFTLLGPVLGRRRLVTEVLAILREELGGVPGCTALRTGEVEDLQPGDPLYHRGRAFMGIPACEPVRARFGTNTCDLDEHTLRGWSVLQTLLPFDSRAVQTALAILAEGAKTSDAMIQPHISAVGASSLNLMSMIWFSREPAAIQRMRALREHLQARFVAQGFHASRQGIDQLHAGRIHLQDDEVLSRIKAALDPQALIAPGRYV